MSAYLCDFATFDLLAEAAKAYSIPHGLTVRLTPEQARELALTLDGRGVQGTHGPRARLMVNELQEQDIGAILWAENWRSINTRYPDTRVDRANAPGRVDEVGMDYRYRCTGNPLRAAQVIAVCNNLRYQSCETEDYEETVAAKLLDAIREGAIGEIVRGEKWGFEEEDTVRFQRKVMA